MKNLLKQATEKLLKAINENNVSLWKADLGETADCILYNSEYIQEDLDDDSTGQEYEGISQELFEVENLLKTIPEKLHEMEELQPIFLAIMDLGMTLRQNQLHSSDDRSGKEVLADYLRSLTKEGTKTVSVNITRTYFKSTDVEIEVPISLKESELIEYLSHDEEVERKLEDELANSSLDGGQTDYEWQDLTDNNGGHL